MPSFWDVKRELTRPTRAAAAEPDNGEAAAWSVSDLARRVNAALRGGLPGEILVRGEISRWQRYGSGHCYFSLKDADACIDAKMWKAAATKLKFEPRVGQEVIVAGRCDYYAPRGQLSLVCDRVDPVGQGALELAFRQLVEKLRGEGLFDRERKRPLPKYPGRICVVTSPRAAGYQDVLKVFERFGHVRLSLYPVPVQGEMAAGRIAEALRDFSKNHARSGRFDALLLCRGGGSIEDLWCFNEEVVARALADVPVPTIVGVGHETDRTVVDFVADRSAHTPTEAAQVLTAAWRVVPERLDQLGVVLRREARDAVRSRRDELSAVRRHEAFRRPTDTVDRLRQRVDERSQAMALALRKLARVASERVGRAASRLASLHPLNRVRLQRGELAAMRNRFESAAQASRREASRRLAEAASDLPRAATLSLRGPAERLSRNRSALARFEPSSQVERERRTLDALARRLDSATRNAAQRRRLAADSLQRQLSTLDPRAVLGRGYSITTRRRDGSVVTAPDDVRPGDVLVTQTAGGDLTSTVGEGRQGELF